MFARRPIPPSLRIRDLDHRERLSIECPACGKLVGRQCYDLALELPADMLVIDYVTRRVCQDCSRPGQPVRAVGWIEPAPRSGAEGYRQRTNENARPGEGRAF